MVGKHGISCHQPSTWHQLHTSTSTFNADDSQHPFGTSKIQSPSIWLVVEPTHLKHMRKSKWVHLPQIGVKIQTYLRNHHPINLGLKKLQFTSTLCCFFFEGWNLSRFSRENIGTFRAFLFLRGTGLQFLEVSKLMEINISSKIVCGDSKNYLAEN